MAGYYKLLKDKNRSCQKKAVMTIVAVMTQRTGNLYTIRKMA